MWIKFFISIVVILLAGLVSLRILFRKSRLPLIFTLPNAFFLGSGIISWQLLIYSIFGFDWSFWSVSLPWFAAGVLRVYSLRRGGFLEFTVPKSNLKLSAFEWLLIAGIAFQLGALLLQFSLQPRALGWDAVSGWFYKAKVFFNEEGVSPVFLSNRNFIIDSDGVSMSYILPDYPPLVPLLVSWVFLSIGSAAIFYGKLLWVLFLLSLLSLFFFVLKECTGRKEAILFTFLLITLPVLFDNLGGKYAGFADLPLASFMVGAVAAWLLFFKKKGSYLLLAVILASFGAFTKYEGLPFLITILTLILLLSPKSFWRQLKFITLVPFFLLSPWWFFRLQAGIETTLHPGGSINPERILTILNAFAGEITNIAHFNLLWLVIILSAIFLLFMKRNKEVFGLFLLLGAQITSYILAFLVTPLDVEKHLTSSVDRLLFQVAPLGLLFAAFVFFPIWNKIHLLSKGKR